ncbi:hypothetical protein ACOSQ4_033314 [Xanthoceras sorbifolium]
MVFLESKSHSFPILPMFGKWVYEISIYVKQKLARFQRNTESSLSARVPSMYILHCSSVFLSFFLFPPLLPLNSGWFPGSFVTFDWGKLELVGEMIVLSLSSSDISHVDGFFYWIFQMRQLLLSL